MHTAKAKIESFDSDFQRFRDVGIADDYNSICSSVFGPVNSPRVMTRSRFKSSLVKMARTAPTWFASSLANCSPVNDKERGVTISSRTGGTVGRGIPSPSVPSHRHAHSNTTGASWMRVIDTSKFEHDPRMDGLSARLKRYAWVMTRKRKNYLITLLRTSLSLR